MTGRHRATLAIFLTLLALPAACSRQSGHVQDEALVAGRTATSFAAATDDYFHAMDGGIALTPDEIQGRNMWLVWTGGNDRFWNQMAQVTFGTLDLLKVISSHPRQGVSRDNRWHALGLVNEPCFAKPTGPDRSRYNLWLDVRDERCPADPFEDASRFPGVAIGSRGHPLSNGSIEPVGSYYGYATGVMGLRLFPNPDFDARAAKAWDAERYYNDPTYYGRADLVRPYRVGVSCGFCHVGPSPVQPPANPEAPELANLRSAVGAQYLRVNRLLTTRQDGKASFLNEVLGTYRPGSMDTSLIASDSINDPRAVTALYQLAARLNLARRLWHERLAGGELNNPLDGGAPAERDAAGNETVSTPHLLADGADSVGLLGSLNRAYLEIGIFSEEWLTHFNPLLGGAPVTPMAIATAERNSVYWQATAAGTPKMAAFLLKASGPAALGEAPGGSSYLAADTATLERGKEVFADSCARCHSSKAPTPPADLNLDADRCSGSLYLECFKRYWTWTQSDPFKAQMRMIVQAPDFLEGNYLSSDARIPVTLLRTNICSSLASNATARDIWDNFSSHTYKQLPSVGTVTLYDPFTGDRFPYEMPAGGRGYTRVPSLVGLWSTAPFLLNNSVGPYDPDPSVASRLQVFDASIEQLLWPEKRRQDAVLTGRVPGQIDRTTQRSWLTIPAARIPEQLRKSPRWVPRFLARDGDLELGPIPKGLPVGLLANLALRADSEDRAVQAVHMRELRRVLTTLTADRMAGETDEQLLGHFAKLAAPLLRLSKCPDEVVNRGHYFGTSQFNDQADLSADERSFGQEPELSDADKGALIAFLKTF